MVTSRAFTLDELELQPGARIKALWQVDGNIMWWDATVDGAAQDERGSKGADRVYSLKYDTYGDYKEQLVRVSFLPGRMLRDVATGDENVWRYDGEAQDEGITLWEAGLELGDRVEVAWKAGGEEADDGAEEWWTATIVGETGDGSIEVIYHARDGYEQERSAVTLLPGGVLKDLSTGDECEWRPLEAASDDTPPSDGTDESLEEGGAVAVAVSEQLLAVEPEPFEIQPQAIEQLGLAPGARIKVRWIALDDDDGPATITYKWCTAALVGVAPENGELWDAATNGTLYSIRYDDDPDGEYDLPAEPLPVLFTSPTTLMQDLCQEPTTINNLMWMREGEPTSTTNAAAVAAKTTAAEAEPPQRWK